MFLNRAGDVPIWRDKGASLFVLQSDQDFMLKGANGLAEIIRSG
jgi:hypothetical protein